MNYRNNFISIKKLTQLPKKIEIAKILSLSIVTACKDI